MKALVAILVLAAGPASGAERWPALHDVEGVEDTDVLNIRAAPGAGSAKIGEFGPDARGIEVISTDGAGSWGKVNAGDRAGWVSLAFLRRQPDQWEGPIPDIRRCFGTEPFWSIDVAPSGLVGYAEPEARKSLGAISWRLGSSSRTDRWAFGSSAEEGGFAATLALDQCTDGMSDREYGLSVDLLLDRGPDDRRLLSGCCTLQAAP